MPISKEAKKDLSASIIGTDTLAAKITINESLVKITFPNKKGRGAEQIRLGGAIVGANWSGIGTDPAGNKNTWTASLVGPMTSTADTKRNTDTTKPLAKITYPFAGFGNEKIPSQETILIKNATVWTNEKEGVLNNTDVLLKNGKIAKVGKDLSAIVEGIARNGEPGVLWMDMSRKYGRLADGVNNKDYRVSGFNPCAEQSLESYECCTLVETYLGRHESLEDYKRTLKFAYLYAKTVTLLPTHWEETNAIMQRNRRIGASMSGVADFADNNGMPVLREWMDEGYKTVQRYDNIYSEWLGVRESIKMTTVKPSGTVSILAGESPGVHWTPGGQFFNRTIRFSNDDPMLPLFKMANYRVEPASESPDTTSVVYFPIKSNAKRSEKDVTIFEKIALAAAAQRYWSDNSVSVTVSFNAETEQQAVS